MTEVVVDTGRYFNNQLKDYDSNNSNQTYLNDVKDGFSPAFRQDIQRSQKELADKLQSFKQDANHDTSVYTGTAGQALAYLTTGNPDLGQKAKSMLKAAVNDKNSKAKKGNRVSFIGGMAGPLVVLAKLGETDTVVQCVKQLLALMPIALSNDVPDEVLFGRAGYLNGLTLVLHQSGDKLSPDLVEDVKSAVKVVCNKILQSGRRYAAQTGCQAPLWWQWHDKEYLGAAHGVGGILNALIKANLSAETMAKEVKPTLDHLINLQFRSGNFPSSLGRSQLTDKLVHWCHGAPGIVHLLLDAYSVLGDRKYLEKAEACGSVIWSRGLLRKGLSICHGVSGNAYSFLHLWQVTSNPKYLHRAAAFISWCFGYRDEKMQPPDRPLSLFEGMAGPLYLFSDVLRSPKLAKFPGYH